LKTKKTPNEKKLSLQKMSGNAERKKSKMKKKEHVRKNKGKDSSLRGL